MVETEPLPGPVESIARAVRSGERTAREVVERYLGVAEARDPDLNAFTELDPEGALRQADLVDAGPRTGPLCGVPIALKDLIDHAGHVTTAGSAFYRHEATVSAPVVDRLEAAGAIIMGRTGLHEFAYGFSSENPWSGPVRNPWDRELSPGGSSGGSAAAVAAGMAPAALGTDTGGSVRVPAAMCGIVGLKVTHGRIPLTGIFPLAGSLDTVGPLTTTVGDARLLFRAMKGFDRSDPWSVPVDDPPRRPPVMEKLRMAVPSAWLRDVTTSDATLRSFAQFCDRLRRLGVTVDEVDAPRRASPPTGPSSPWQPQRRPPSTGSGSAIPPTSTEPISGSVWAWPPISLSTNTPMPCGGGRESCKPRGNSSPVTTCSSPRP